jgi:hypothetical protein
VSSCRGNAPATKTTELIFVETEEGRRKWRPLLSIQESRFQSFKALPMYAKPNLRTFCRMAASGENHPKMKDLDQAQPFVNAIINQDRRMRELPHTGAMRHWAADLWKAPQYFQMVQKGIPKSFCEIGEIGPEVCKDFFEIG